MASDDNQKRVFEFLVDRFETKEPFSRQELEQVTTWSGTTFPTYWSKQLRPLVVDAGPGKHRVSEAFRRYATWDRFQEHVTQVRHASADYRKLEYGIVRVYEFFMPLTNEGNLRAALDALFYKDTIEARLRTIDRAELLDNFPRNGGETEQAYGERLCAWISDRFGGYSIYHVNGRFRAQPLATRADVGRADTRYLVDETTAVTRFIFPCEDIGEADLVAFLFTNLFVRAIIEVVNGEDEIWMVETGVKNQLHIWRVASS